MTKLGFKEISQSNWLEPDRLSKGFVRMSSSGEFQPITGEDYLRSILNPMLLESVPKDVQALFEQRYAGEVFVDVLPAGSQPDTRSVRGANTCRIALHRPQQGDTVVVLSVIDNLMKGAAGQAVQNMNIMFGLPESLALEVVPLLP